ncbi:MAG TPA: PadR family transcriptional regulator [Thermoanaerobaculia bacterium]|nr:PadR family transcriptional regulator [Thermoanaerobaculia bacterium]
MTQSGLELVRGTLDMLVLQALTWGPLHGYGVAGVLRRRSGEELVVEEGALYPALHRLEQRGLVGSEWGLSENNRRARYYQLTAAGRRHLAAEVDAWRRYRDAVDQVLLPAEA